MAPCGRHSLIWSTVQSLLGTSWRGRSHRCASLHTSRAACCAVGSGEELPSSNPAPPTTRESYTSKVKSRGVILLDGPDVFKFLQGLVTNDVTTLEANLSRTSVAASTLIYTALLNAQGRFLYDLFLYRPTNPIMQFDRVESGPWSGDNGVPYLLADADTTFLDELVSHLCRHRLRAKVRIENISSDLTVWQKFGASSSMEAGGENRRAIIDRSIQITEGIILKDWHWYSDPRLKVLGLRGIFPSNVDPPLVKAGQEVGEDHYLLRRLEQGVAEGSTEIPKGEAIPLEFNLAGLNAISFEKGCYVGQELIARTHHRGVIRKRVVPVNFVNEEGQGVNEEVFPGVEIVDVLSKKKVGKVTTVLGSRGLALLRLDAAFKGLSRLKVDISPKDIYLRVTRPNWWSGAWGQEEQQEHMVNA